MKEKYSCVCKTCKRTYLDINPLNHCCPLCFKQYKKFEKEVEKIIKKYPDIDTTSVLHEW